jgi:hypothetical protein
MIRSVFEEVFQHPIYNHGLKYKIRILAANFKQGTHMLMFRHKPATSPEKGTVVI